MARRPSRPRGESDLGRPNTLYNGKPRPANGGLLKRRASLLGTPRYVDAGSWMLGVG
jgi:hypothetical protein